MDSNDDDEDFQGSNLLPWKELSEDTLAATCMFCGAFYPRSKLTRTTRKPIHYSQDVCWRCIGEIAVIEVSPDGETEVKDVSEFIPATE